MVELLSSGESDEERIEIKAEDVFADNDHVLEESYNEVEFVHFPSTLFSGPAKVVLYENEGEEDGEQEITSSVMSSNSRNGSNTNHNKNSVN